MAVVERKGPRGIVYWVHTYFRGRQYAERAGTNRRLAERLNDRRKAEVKAGTFVPELRSEGATVESYAALWVAQRQNRTANDDRQRLRDYVLNRPWLAKLRLRQVEQRHSVQLLTELQQEMPIERQKTIKNVWGAWRTMMRDARIAGLVRDDVTLLPRNLMRKAKKNHYRAYDVAEVERLLGDTANVPLVMRVAFALAVFTGMRKGEVCGRRWRDIDWNTSPMPLLHVATQYDDQPLKEDNPRNVPVHPLLAAVLRAWWAEGWELFTLRPPTLDDFIIPNDGLRSSVSKPHTESSLYKAWRRACLHTGVRNRSFHSTRTTMITWARRHRCDPSALEVITHNAGGSIVDGYTDWAWAPLCEVVAVLPFRWLDAASLGGAVSAPVSALTQAAGKTLPNGGSVGNRTRQSSGADAVNVGESAPRSGRQYPPIPRAIRRADARLDALQSHPAAWSLAFAYAAAVARRVA